MEARCSNLNSIICHNFEGFHKIGHSRHSCMGQTILVSVNCSYTCVTLDLTAMRNPSSLLKMLPFIWLQPYMNSLKWFAEPRRAWDSRTIVDLGHSCTFVTRSFIFFLVFENTFCVSIGDVLTIFVWNGPNPIYWDVVTQAFHLYIIKIILGKPTKESFLS